MAPIDISHYLNQIKDIARQYISAEVIPVKDVNEYIQQIGGPLNKTSPVAQALWNSETEPDKIIVRNIINENDINSSASAMRLQGFYGEVKKKI